MTIVSNSSPLIALSRIGQIELLPMLFGTILIPSAVYQEVVTQGIGQSGSKILQQASWLTVEAVADPGRVQYLLTTLDWGEAEALVLAQEQQARRLLLDEIKARALARQLGIPVIGTAGLLVLAKQRGHIAAVKPLLDALLANEFRLSSRVYQTALAQAGE